MCVCQAHETEAPEPIPDVKLALDTVIKVPRGSYFGDPLHEVRQREETLAISDWVSSVVKVFGAFFFCQFLGGSKWSTRWREYGGLTPAPFKLHGPQAWRKAKEACA